MYYWRIFVIVSFLWVVFEIYLAVARRAKSAPEHDRNSKRLMWTVIAVSIAGGAFLAFSGYGFLKCCVKALSISGIFFIILGQIIRGIAILTLKRYFTTNVAILEGHKIIKTGIYKYIRHPAYLGDIVSFLGLALAFSSWISFLLIFIPVTAIFIYRIKIEEQVLIEAFGHEYLEYSRKTARLIPLIY